MRGFPISTLSNTQGEKYDLLALPFYSLSLLDNIPGRLFSPSINHELMADINVVKMVAYNAYGVYRLCYVGTDEDFIEFCNKVKNADAHFTVISKNTEAFIKKFPKENIITHSQDEKSANKLKKLEFIILTSECLNENLNFFIKLVRNKKDVEGVTYDDIL